MVIYEVRCSIITAISVKNETKTGWREHNGGFITKTNQNAKASAYGFGSVMYFNCHKSAIKYSREMRREVGHALDVGFASESDIDFWVEFGSNEDSLPKARIN